MPGSMPYSLEKGPYLSVIEDYVNGSRGRALETLARLRNGDAIDELDAFDSQPLDAGPYSTDAAPGSLQAGLARLHAGRGRAIGCRRRRSTR